MTQTKSTINRRSALKASAGFVAAAVGPAAVSPALGFESPNARPRIGVIGCGIRWDKRVFDPDGRYGVGKEFPKFGDIVSVCDVDANRLDRAIAIAKGWLGKTPDGTGDYRKIIDDPQVDVVHISTPAISQE